MASKDNEKTTASKTSSSKSTSSASKSTSKSSSKTSSTKSSGKSSSKANANRVKKAVKQYDTSKGVQDNASAIAGIAAATATSAKRASNKKQKKLYTALLVIIIVAIVAVAVYGYLNGWFTGSPILPPDGGNGNGGGNGGDVNVSNGNYNVSVISGEELSIHFMELGNNYTGDSVYIKAGDTDILIDAGSRNSSAGTIAQYVNQYCTDGILEYVIVTHAHQDHIAGFVGTKDVPGIFARYQCQNIIQFANTNATSGIYENYCTERDKEVAAGANLFTAQDCVSNANGAKKVYNLSDTVTMEILDQGYYRDTTSNENNYSVCVLISQGDNHYLLTGDLEGEGEESLVATNPNLPQCVLYKGGHHGSYTAASDVLLKKIKPQCVCICCCAGSVEYLTGKNQNLSHSFPAQEFCDRVAPYTDKVYATTVGSVTWDEEKQKYKDSGFESLNGNIVFACTNGKVTMYFSNNDTKLKDTDWFKENREMPDAWKTSD